VFDDTADAIQTQLRSDHAASQLSLGSITRIEDWQGRQDARGEGFELRTDAVGAIRSGKGMLVSTEARSLGKSHIADIYEPVSRLTNAQAMHDGLGKMAQQHQAQDIGGDQSTVADALQSQIEGIKGTTGSRGNDSFTELADPHLLLAGASGVQATTPATVHVSGGEHVALTAGRNVSVTAGKSLLASVAEKISLFAQNAGMKLFAAKGKVEVRAYADNVEVTAQKAVKIVSATESIEAVAKDQVLLSSGGAYIRIKDGNIEIHAPGKIDIKGAQHSFAGPTSLAQTYNLEGKKADMRIRYVDADGNVPTGEPLHFAAEDGTTHSVSLDGEGKAELKNINFGSFTAVQPQRVGD
jgi:type VI secretion system secreted protein VgrG